MTQPSHTDDDILRLIQVASADGERAMLTVLYQINKNLVQNTQLTIETVERMKKTESKFAAYRTDFDQHVTGEAARFNKGIGAWRAVSFMSVLITATSGYILSHHLADMKTLQIASASQDLELRSARERINSIEAVAARNTSILDTLSQKDRAEHPAVRLNGITRGN